MTFQIDMTDKQFDRLAIEIPTRERRLGGLARLVSMHRSGTEHFAAERSIWQDGLTVANIVRELENKVRSITATSFASHAVDPRC